jgi:hypothetical protein
MGGACLRGHGHHWPAGGSRRAAARGRWQGQLADKPDAAGAHAGAQLLRAGGDPDAVHQCVAQGQPHAVADAQAVDVGLGLALGERDRQRLGDPMPFANRDGDALSVPQRHREGVELALS